MALYEGAGIGLATLFLTAAFWICLGLAIGCGRGNTGTTCPRVIDSGSTTKPAPCEVVRQ